MKKVFSFIFVGVLTFSGILPILSLGDQSINTYESAGFIIVELFSLVYVYSYYSRNKTIKIVSVSGIMCGYLTTLLVLGRTFSKYVDVPFKLGIGFYLYLLSFIIFLVSLFINEKKQLSEEEKKITEQFKDKKYIIPIYMYGIKNRPELANNKCSLSYNDDNTVLNVRIVNKDSLEEIDIPFDSINNINVRPSLTMVKTTYSPQEDAYAISLIGAYMFGPVGSMVGQLMDNSSSSVSTKYSSVFVTEINYVKNNENEKIVVQTNYPPREFFFELKEKYEEQQI